MTNEIGVQIGFIQGRLVAQVNGMIQAFPSEEWRKEFPVAASHGFDRIEWTVGRDDFDDNPLMTELGREEIARVADQFSVVVGSVTGDCFMHAPFYKESGGARSALLKKFRQVVEACNALSVSFLVVPLVDNGSIESAVQEQSLVEGVVEVMSGNSKGGVSIAFETDQPAKEVLRFIDRLPGEAFGINYDTGNSAAVGYDPAEELRIFGARVVNVHVKDRVLGGTTVPLGTGATDFEAVFSALERLNYVGPYMLQTARAQDGDHLGALCRYRDQTVRWIRAAREK